MNDPVLTDLPSGEELLERERSARHRGTGLGPADLIGCWRLQAIWRQRTTQPMAVSAAILRSLSAHLELGPGPAEASLAMVNRVNLGLLQLRFEGSASLEGQRPLLFFVFERLQLRLGAIAMLTWRLPAPERRRRPFFALIARKPAAGTCDEAESGWLAARGRGGGLALWCRD